MPATRNKKSHAQKQQEEMRDRVFIGPEELRERLAGIELVLMDVDGVLTDGKFYFLPNPASPDQLVETKAFDSQDGLALQWLRQVKISAGLISGRDSPATLRRAETAEFRYVFQGHLEKKSILNQILADSGIRASAILYIGDDVTDIVIMRRIGVAVAVANARKQVKKVAHIITEAPGGSGAVRETIEMLLEAKGLLNQVLEPYEATD